jgi:hypothetical protein
MKKVYTNYLYLIGLALGLVACNEPKTFVPTNTDRFVYDNNDFYQQADQILQADYMIVPDVSYSMLDSKNKVLEALNLFSQELISEGIDYRIGFVRGTTQSAGFYYGAIPSNFMASVLTASSSSSIVNQVATALSSFAGANAPNWVFILEAAKKTVEAQKNSFLRESAQLVYVFISDNDERTHSSTGNLSTSTQFVNKYSPALQAVKTNSAYVNARAIVHGAGGCATLNYPGAAQGTRLSAVANSIEGSSNGTVCIQSTAQTLADSLSGLARDVTKTTKRFKIQAQPDPNTIEVRVGTAGNLTSATGWSYHANTNEIVFANGSEPQPSQQVEITFEMLMKLSKAPRINTVVVTKNGALVPQSDANGWTYNASTKEIRLVGTYKPNHTDLILVNYQVQ